MIINIFIHFVNVGTPFCLAGKHVIGWIWTAKGQRMECSYFTMSSTHLCPDGSHFHSFSLYPPAITLILTAYTVTSMSRHLYA